MQRRSLPLGAAVPFGLLMLAAGIWSIGWFYAASQADRELTEWRLAMAESGAELRCREESGGGFPFRLSLECVDPMLSVTIDNARYQLTGSLLRAVTQVYDTDHFIVEVDAPTELTGPVADAGPTRLATSTDGTLRASIELERGVPRRISIVPPAFEAFIPEGGRDGPVARLGVAASALHMRNRPADNAYDIALKGSGVAFDGTIGEGETIRVSTFDLVTAFNQVPDTDVDKWDSFLSRWRAAGGNAEIRKVAFDSPNLGVEAAGKVEINDAGHLSGELDAAFTRLKEFVAILKGRGLLTANEAQLTAGAVGFLGRSIRGRPGVVLPVRITDGKIFVGPVKTVALPPLI